MNKSKVFQADWIRQNPGELIPEELQEPETLIDSTKIKFFAPYTDGFSFASVPQGTQTLVIKTFANDQTWENLTALRDSPAKDTIEILYLGHDGVIFGDEADILTTLDCLPNLKEVHYCGYYAHYEDLLCDIVETRNLEAIPIY